MDIYRRALAQFADRHRDSAPQIRQACSKDAIAEASQLAHALRGGAAILGADGLVPAVAELEDALRCGDRAAAEAPAPAIAAGLDPLLVAIAEGVPSPAPVVLNSAVLTAEAPTAPRDQGT